ncbi:MAG: hypothetical protein HFH57_15370 [Lachnospiraceae bacterium]|nr:hypothetical protein [Lachnospiraceae bacterium]
MRLSMWTATLYIDVIGDTWYYDSEAAAFCGKAMEIHRNKMKLYQYFET